MTRALSDADLVCAQLRAFIEDSFLYMRPGMVLSDDDDFVALRILDSLGFVELVEEVQTRYEIPIEDCEITQEHFGSIRRIADLVDRKRRGT